MSSSSLLYLHKKTLSSHAIKNDVDFLLGLIKEKGTKQKRWENYLAEHESMSEDGNIHSHSSLLEHLAFREVTVEGLSDERAILLMWTARFHKLGELRRGDILYNLKTVNDKAEKVGYLKEHVQGKLKSKYAKEMLEKVLAISLDEKNLSEDEFDFVDFFSSLKCRGHINTALRMIQQQEIAQYDILAANVLFNQIMPLVGYSGKYRSVRVYLKKNASRIDQAVKNHLTHKKLKQSFKLIYQQDDFEQKQEFLDISPEKVAQIKSVWLTFVEEN
jgi:hypothetical protein